MHKGTSRGQSIVPALFLREESIRKGISIEWSTMVRWPEHDDDDEVSILGERAHQGPFFGSMRTHRAIGSLGVPFGHQRRAAVAVSGYLVYSGQGRIRKRNDQEKKKEREREIKRDKERVRSWRELNLSAKLRSRASVFTMSRFNLIIRTSWIEQLTWYVCLLLNKCGNFRW